jgi:hypothetical protein
MRYAGVPVGRARVLRTRSLKTRPASKGALRIHMFARVAAFLRTTIEYWTEPGAPPRLRPLIYLHARTDSNRRPPGSKLEGIEKLEILKFGSR